MSFIYLATPHNHLDAEVRKSRFREAQLAASIVYAYQIPCYSPIAHWHPISIDFELPHGWDYWKQQDEAMLLASQEMWVIMIDGWNTSKGIEAEIKFCQKNSKNIHWIDPLDLAKFCRKRQEGHGRV
jgi:hypothetical protein